MRRSSICLAMVLLLCAADAQAVLPSAAATQLSRKEISKVELQGVSLKRVFEFLRGATGANLQPDWEVLNGAGVTESSAARLAGANIALSKALDISLASLTDAQEPLDWYIDGNIFHITTQRAALAARRNQPVIQSESARPVRTGSPVTNVDFQGIPLGETLEFLRSVSGLNFAVNWNSLSTVGVDQTMSISVQATNVTVWKALDMVLAQVNVGKGRLDSVYWDMADNVVTITTGAELDRQLIVRVYDVGDLLMVVPNFPGPQLSLGQSNAVGNRGNGNTSGGNTGLFGSGNTGQTGGAASQNPEASVTEQRDQLRAGLVQAVQATTGADLWEPLGRGTITFLGGKMIISQTALGYKLIGQSIRGR